MDNQNQQLSAGFSERVNQTAVFRAIWLFFAAGVVSLVVAATPLRYQMLQADVYGFADGLQSLGLSLPFFATYFTILELILIIGSLGVAALIAWKRPNDWMATLAAVTLALFGLLPPLADGLIYARPAWAIPLSALRMLVWGCTMALICLFPNGRFMPRWTGWLFLLWLFICVFAFLNNPLLMADMAMLPNTRTLTDGLWLLLGAGWFTVGLLGQIVRYRRFATTTERQQMKWLLWGPMLLIFSSTISILLLIGIPALRNVPDQRTLFTIVMGGFILLAALAIPATIAFSILRYRLWDVDVWLNRTLIYGGLTALVTAVYVLLVGGVGSLAITEQSNLAAFVVATVLVLLGIRPLHRWLQKQVDRLLPPPPQITSSATTHRSTRSILLQTAWVFNFLMAVILFSAGLILQASYGIWQMPPPEALTTVPLLASIPTGNTLLLESGLYPFALIAAYIQAAIFVLVGLFLFWRRSGELMGVLASMMLIAVGLGFTPTIVFLPLLAPVWHLPATLFQAGLFGSVFLFLCLFPNGRFYPKWSRYAAAIWLIYVLLWLPFPQLNLHRATTIWPPLIFAVVVFLGIGFQIIRYRRLSASDEKQQAKWVIAGFVVANLGLFSVALFLGLQPVQSNVFMGTAMLLLGMASSFIPLAIGVALFRYRLWEIDIIINRTLVYGGLSLGIVAIYVLVVGALGTLFQAQGNFLIALLATGVIAVLFQPVRERLQHSVNRLMFGERDDPYAALSKLAGQLQTTTTPEAMLQSVVETIASTLKLPYVAVELGDEQGQLGGAATGKPVAATVNLPLRYQNEAVGQLVVSPRSPGEAFTEREQRLLADMAAQTGAMAYSVRLTAALQRSATALQQSREKLVLTREEERRRIRRDLHDGLGPTLASQTFAFDAILDLMETNPAEAARLLRGLKAQNQETVAEIRRLVYALRPPALDELGLMDALQAHVGKLNGRSPLIIQLNAAPDPLPPLSAAVEVAAYRITLEAITNVMRHAQAQRCEVQVQVVGNGRTTLQITVSDDGIGLPPAPPSGVGIRSMRERAEELGGSLTVVKQKKGTRVTAVLPLLLASELEHV